MDEHYRPAAAGAVAVGIGEHVSLYAAGGGPVGECSGPGLIRPCAGV